MLNKDANDGSRDTNNDSSLLEAKQQTITPHENDVVSGRGSGANRHVGNAKFRQLVKDNKMLYMSLTKHEKMSVARKILATISSCDPSGRFLQKNPETFQWFEIGLSRALEKISQALREKTHQPVQNKLPQCQISHPQDFWPESFYHRYTQGGVIDDGRHPISNSMENQLYNPSKFAEEIKQFHSAMVSTRNQRNGLGHQHYHKLNLMMKQNGSNQNNRESLKYHYNHSHSHRKLSGKENGIYKSMIPLNRPLRIDDRVQSFSMTCPSQTQGDWTSSKYTPLTDFSLMPPSIGRRHVLPTPQVRDINNLSNSYPFPPLPQPPIPPKLPHLAKARAQTLHDRGSRDRNPISTCPIARLPSKPVLIGRHQTSRSIGMRLPPSKDNPLSPQRRKPFSSLSDHPDVYKRGTLHTTQTNRSKRGSESTFVKKSKKLCLDVEAQSNVVSSESNDEETSSTQSLNTDSKNSSKTNSPLSSNEEIEGEDYKQFESMGESSGLLALSTAALMHAQERAKSPSLV